MITSSAMAQEVPPIIIFPVDVQTMGSSYNIYPNTLNLISGDIYNAFAKKGISVEYPLETDKKINNLLLVSHYNRLLQDFKNYQLVNYQECRLLAQKIGASKVILVSGGYDAQGNILKERHLLGYFDWLTYKDFTSTYKLNITVTLIDPYGEKVISEKNFSKEIPADNFASPSQYFGENVVPIKEIKTFSNTIAYRTVFDYKNVSTKSKVTKINTTDGYMTTDGHFNSMLNSFDTVIQKKRDNFKTWVMENF